MRSGIIPAPDGKQAFTVSKTLEVTTVLGIKYYMIVFETILFLIVPAAIISV